MAGYWLMVNHIINNKLVCMLNLSCKLQILLSVILAKGLDPDQARQNIDKMSGLIWIQTVSYPDGIPERIFLKS